MGSWPRSPGQRAAGCLRCPFWATKSTTTCTFTGSVALPDPVIIYFFLLVYYISLKHLLPLLEELRLVIKLKNKDDPSNLTPEERGPLLHESLWIGLTHLLLSFFHFVTVIAGNTFEESPIGVSSLIGSEVLNNFIQMGLIGLLSRQILYVNSWMAIRDTVVSSLSCIMFLAFVFFEDSFIMGIFFWVILLIYWVLEVLSKRISKKVCLF